jgi:hypothetical protein
LYYTNIDKIENNFEKGLLTEEESEWYRGVQQVNKIELYQ